MQSRFVDGEIPNLNPDGFSLSQLDPIELGRQLFCEMDGQDKCPHYTDGFYQHGEAGSFPSYFFDHKDPDEFWLGIVGFKTSEITQEFHDKFVKGLFSEIVERLTIYYL